MHKAPPLQQLLLRTIQDEQVGSLYEHGGEVQPASLPSTEALHLLELLLSGEAHALQHHLRGVEGLQASVASLAVVCHLPAGSG